MEQANGLTLALLNRHPQGTIDVHTLNCLRERITIDPVTDEQYEKLCKTRLEMEKLRHNMVTDILIAKRVKRRPANYLPTRTHLPSQVRRVAKSEHVNPSHYVCAIQYGKDPVPRTFNRQPEIDPVWVQFALDHHVKFEDALVPLNRRMSTTHSFHMQAGTSKPDETMASRRGSALVKSDAFNDMFRNRVRVSAHVTRVCSTHGLSGKPSFQDAERARIAQQANDLRPVTPPAPTIKRVDTEDLKAKPRISKSGGGSRDAGARDRVILSAEDVSTRHHAGSRHCVVH